MTQRYRLPAQMALVGITDSALCGGIDAMLDRCELLLRAGLPTLMIREKHLNGRDLYELAVRLREDTRRYNALLLINDRPDVAMAVQADGIHLGGTAVPAHAMRSVVPPDYLLGVSAHSRSDLEAAQRFGADYATISPIFPTTTKPDAPTLGYRGLTEAITGLRIPVIALGGITKENSVRAMAAGAYGVAAISALFDKNASTEDLEDFIA